ncbi:MAG: hypothetical protein ACOCVL_00385 [Candidatus Sumerlaeota bacterium]
MKNLIKHNTNSKRGTVLVTTFFLTAIVAFSALYLVINMRDHQRTNQRSRELMHAFLAAEAGVAQVVHWGNYPDEYDGGGETGRFFRAPDTSFPNLTPESLSPYVLVPNDKLDTFTTDYGREISQIKEIRLLPPDADNDPVDCLFKVQSTGETPSGRDRVVMAYINPSPVKHGKVALQAGLISLSTAAQLGNGKVHWGESWSKQDFDVLSKSQLDNLDNTDSDYDPYAKYRSEGQLIFDNTWKIFDPGKPKKGGDLHNPDSARWPGDLPTGSVDPYEEAFEQFIPEGVLEWPDFLSEYETFKTQAKSSGRYFSTDASGNIYRDGVETAENIVNFDDEFGDADRENSPYDLVFIDTIDGNPPADDGSNLATIQNSGNNIGMKGVFYLCANYDQQGIGNPATLDSAEKPNPQPDGSTEYTMTSLSKVYLDGIIYAAGTVRFQGNPVIYGACIAEKGYLSGGTPDIYFNHNLVDGLEIPRGNVGSNFLISLQDNY